MTVETFPSCGHCGATLRADAPMLGIETPDGEGVELAAEHSSCLSEWGVIYEDGHIFHLHEVD